MVRLLPLRDRRRAGLRHALLQRAERPLIAAWLVSRGDGSLWLVATSAVAVAALSLTCAHLLPGTCGRDLDAAWVDAEHREEALVRA